MPRFIGQLLLAVLATTSGVLNASPVTGLDWHFKPDHDLSMVRLTQDRPTLTGTRPQWEQPNPVVLPLPEWPDKKTDNRGWQLVDPSVGVAGVQNSDETRTAVKIAQNQQSEQLNRKAAPVPGQKELPGPLANIGLKITMGVQYVF